MEATDLKFFLSLFWMSRPLTVSGSPPSSFSCVFAVLLLWPTQTHLAHHPWSWLNTPGSRKHRSGWPCLYPPQTSLAPVGFMHSRDYLFLESMGTKQGSNRVNIDRISLAKETETGTCLLHLGQLPACVVIISEVLLVPHKDDWDIGAEMFHFRCPLLWNVL